MGEYQVSWTVWSKTVSPVEISSILDMLPDWSAVRTDRVNAPAGRKSHRWTRCQRGDRVRELVDSVIGMLMEMEYRLIRLSELGCVLTMDVRADTLDENPGGSRFVLSADQVDFLSRFIGCFTPYSYIDEDDPGLLKMHIDGVPSVVVGIGVQSDGGLPSSLSSVSGFGTDWYSVVSGSDDWDWSTVMTHQNHDDVEKVLGDFCERLAPIASDLASVVDGGGEVRAVVYYCSNWDATAAGWVEVGNVELRAFARAKASIDFQVHAH